MSEAKRIRLIGVIHLPPLPGSPRAPAGASMSVALEQCVQDARILSNAGYDAVIVENFGDAPFYRGPVPAVTISAMTACAAQVRMDCPGIELGINVLRNDVRAAISIAAIVGASFVRANVWTGARVTDQGIIEGDAADSLRLRRELQADWVKVFADIDVKHSEPLAERNIEEEAHETYDRGLADAILITGSGTGARANFNELKATRRALPGAAIYIASGVVISDLDQIAADATGVIVGSTLRADGRAGGPISEAKANEFARAFRRAFGA